MNLQEAITKVKDLDAKGIVPDFDNTLYWCPECNSYQRFVIYGPEVPPGIRCECQGGCDTACRLIALLLGEDEHPPICST